MKDEYQEGSFKKIFLDKQKQNFTDGTQYILNFDFFYEKDGNIL